MEKIEERLRQIKDSLPEEVTLVAVSKTKSEAEIMEAYNSGQRIFGENKVQELSGKWEKLPKDIEWHMIGHLQRNKVKYLAPFINLIHGVDSLRLLKEINKRAGQQQRVIDCLLQIHIAKEESKFGLDEAELSEIVTKELLDSLPHVRIRGLMGMATFTDNETRVRSEFRYLKSLFDALPPYLEQADILSMGMSGDYLWAIDEGSTMVRIGSSIFGARNTH